MRATHCISYLIALCKGGVVCVGLNTLRSFSIQISQCLTGNLIPATFGFMSNCHQINQNSSLMAICVTMT